MLIKINFTVSSYQHQHGRQRYYEMSFWRTYKYVCEEVTDSNSTNGRKQTDWENGLNISPIQRNFDPESNLKAIYEYDNFVVVSLPKNCSKFVKEEFTKKFADYINKNFTSGSGLTSYEAHQATKIILKALNIDTKHYKEHIACSFFSRLEFSNKEFDLPVETSVQIQNFLSLQDIKNLAITCKSKSEGISVQLKL
ncbi:Uncharacterised protein [Legionella busanensis]|uniref:Uncharacterized protein n=1 Tax=Legionella busanensis TaxID=190655 RepID=A0A378JJ86_9GAMM|nr:hypothetical protein [Legionella busanensis]STX51137.1 Uncharacterised protein [Legionella busanensis]